MAPVLLFLALLVHISMLSSTSTAFQLPSSSSRFTANRQICNSGHRHKHHQHCRTSPRLEPLFASVERTSEPMSFSLQEEDDSSQQLHASASTFGTDEKSHHGNVSLINTNEIEVSLSQQPPTTSKTTSSIQNQPSHKLTIPEMGGFQFTSE